MAAVEASVNDYMKRRGISLSRNWLKACIESIRQNHPHSLHNVNEAVYTHWINTDIKQTSLPSLPPAILQEPSGTLTGSHIVQIESIVNVGSSAYSQLMKLKGKDTEENEANNVEMNKPTRMLHLKLTDGGLACNGMEYSLIRSVNTDSSPGIKICLTGPIRYRLGTLLLTDDNVSVLGGAVEDLVNINNQEKVLARELNREDLISEGEERELSQVVDPELIILMSINELKSLIRTHKAPPTVYVKATILRLNGSLSPDKGVWYLQVTIADGTGEMPAVLGNAPLEILIGINAPDFYSVPRTQGEEGLRKCQEVLSRLHCVMELTITNEPTITRLLDIEENI